MSLIKAVAVASALVVAALALPASAGERWLKIMPDDPYSKEGVFHHFDVDSVFEDRATGYVVSRMIYVKPEEAAAGPAAKWLVWAFDCKAKTVYYVSGQGESGTVVTEGWRAKPNSLKAPVMGGVTNTFGKKVCALKGSWPAGALP
ncbi:MAG: hypothetical protein ABL996_27430 [Micropepsaceae bacterium]